MFVSGGPRPLQEARGAFELLGMVVKPQKSAVPQYSTEMDGMKMNMSKLSPGPGWFLVTSRRVRGEWWMLKTQLSPIYGEFLRIENCHLCLIHIKHG